MHCMKAEQTPLMRGGARDNANVEKIRDERNNLRNALIGAQESAIIQCLLEAIDPARGDMQIDKRMVLLLRRRARNHSLANVSTWRPMEATPFDIERRQQPSTREERRDKCRTIVCEQLNEMFNAAEGNLLLVHYQVRVMLRSSVM